jgi:hypothetical protein
VARIGCGATRPRERQPCTGMPGTPFSRKPRDAREHFDRPLRERLQVIPAEPASGSVRPMAIQCVQRYAGRSLRCRIQSRICCCRAVVARARRASHGDPRVWRAFWLKHYRINMQDYSADRTRVKTSWSVSVIVAPASCNPPPCARLPGNEPDNEFFMRNNFARLRSGGHDGQRR